MRSVLYPFVFVLLAVPIRPNGRTVVQTRPAAKDNIILITIDTLRADHLGCYGNSRIKTPNVDALSKEGARFSTVVSQSPLTLPSHCSILTGTYPFVHGVHDNVGYRLPESQMTLAEALKPYGYRTGAFVGAFVLDSRFGLNQGFDVYHDRFDLGKVEGGMLNANQLERRGEKVLENAVHWIERAPNDPLFAWIHFYDPHDPYEPPAPYRSLYSASPYDGEIAYVDEQIGKLVALLKKWRIYDKTWIVLTSDHGEGLGEHQESRHGYFIYDSTLLVPLIIKPGRALFNSVVVSQQVRSIDIVPTIMEALGIPPPKQIQGVGLFSVILGKQKDLQLEAYSETYYPNQFGWSELLSIRKPEAKFIRAPRPEFFDLQHDPRELQNSYGPNRTVATRMNRRLKEIEDTYSPKGSPRGRGISMTTQELEKLLALGYIAGATGRTETRADPKDKLDIFNLMNRAGRSATSGNCSQAAPILTEVIRREPSMEAAHFMLGRCYFNEKDYDRALAVFRKLVELNPTNAEAQFYAASCEFNQEKLEAAERDFLKVLAINPEHVYAHKHLGFIFQFKGQNERAIQEFQKVVALSPDDIEAHGKLGFIFAANGRNREAIPHFRKVVSLDPSNGSAHFNLGLAYVKTHQQELAQKEMAAACRLDAQLCPKK